MAVDGTQPRSWAKTAAGVFSTPPDAKKRKLWVLKGAPAPDRIQIERPPTVTVVAARAAVRAALAGAELQPHERASTQIIAGSASRMATASVRVANGARASAVEQKLRDGILEAGALAVVVRSDAHRGRGTPVRLRPAMKKDASGYKCQLLGGPAGAWPLRLQQMIEEKEYTIKGAVGIVCVSGTPWVELVVRSGKWNALLQWATENRVAAEFDASPKMWGVLIPAVEHDVARQADRIYTVQSLVEVQDGWGEAEPVTWKGRPYVRLTLEAPEGWRPPAVAWLLEDEGEEVEVRMVAPEEVVGIDAEEGECEVGAPPPRAPKTEAATAASATAATQARRAATTAAPVTAPNPPQALRTAAPKAGAAAARPAAPATAPAATAPAAAAAAAATAAPLLPPAVTTTTAAAGAAATGLKRRRPRKRKRMEHPPRAGAGDPVSAPSPSPSSGSDGDDDDGLTVDNPVAVDDAVGVGSAVGGSRVVSDPPGHAAAGLAATAAAAAAENGRVSPRGADPPHVVASLAETVVATAANNGGVSPCGPPIPTRMQGTVSPPATHPVHRDSGAGVVDVEEIMPSTVTAATAEPETQAAAAGVATPAELPADGTAAPIGCDHPAPPTEMPRGLTSVIPSALRDNASIVPSPTPTPARPPAPALASSAWPSLADAHPPILGQRLITDLLRPLVPPPSPSAAPPSSTPQSQPSTSRSGTRPTSSLSSAASSFVPGDAGGAVPPDVHTSGSSSRRAGRAKPAFYAVYGGRGGDYIYRSWDATERNISGVSGARQRRFSTLEAAQEQLRDWGVRGPVRCES